MDLDDWIAALARRVAADLSREPPPDVLWQRFREENDQYAAVVLIALHGRPVWNYCRTALADYHAAEEVFQDAFRDLYRCRHRIRHHAAVRGWLLRTAGNKVRDTWRRQGRRPAVALLNPDADFAVSPTEVGTDAEATREEIHRLLGRLPQNERRAIELVYLAGLSHRDAAEALNVPEGTLSSWVTRALERLRRTGGGEAAASCGLAVIGPLSGRSVGAVPVELIAITAARLAIPTGRLTGTAGGWSLSRVATGLVGIGGAAAIGLALCYSESSRPTATTAVARVDQQTPSPVLETVRQRTARIFHSEVEPTQIDALRKVFLGHGPIVLDSFEIAGTWTNVVYRQSIGALPVRMASIELTHDTESGRTEIFADLNGSGRRKPINPAKMIILVRESESSPGLALQHPDMLRAINAFDAIPRDARSAAEAIEYPRRVEAAVQPYLGLWHPAEQPEAECRITWASDVLTFVGPDGREAGLAANHLVLDQHGALAVTVWGNRVQLSADGEQLTFAPKGNIWSHSR